MTYRIGVDIGGTFTDFALCDDADGRMVTHKRLTTPADPAIAVLEGVDAILGDHGVRMDAVTAVVHGTTLVTNAIIEGKGARTAMLVTGGFRDILDIALERRYDLFDLRLVLPPPAVPRWLRVEVPERLDFDGRVVVPLDLEAVQDAVRGVVEREGIEAVAICFLHAYVDARHETAVRDWIAREFPDLYVSLSSEVFPFMREYERWTTTCLNACVQPTVDRYLGRLESGLAGRGFRGRLYVMSSSGGTLTPAVARRFPIRLLESGPAAGALMSARHGRSLAMRQVLSFDMGGTTAKGCIIRDGRPLKRYSSEIARVHEVKRGSGLPVQIPVVDMIEIGAGGGSIAAIDDRGVLTVGPRSAGADPGPACYGHGGEDATLTDANLLLGYLDEATFLGGRMRIDRGLAEKAVRRRIAEPLGVDPIRAAWGIHEVVNEDVARAFRVHASERGVDYRRCSMIAFGGSGPIHALRIARKLRIPRVVCAPGAGVMSAFGLLASPLGFELLRSRRMALADVSAEAFTESFRALEQEALSVLPEVLASEDLRLRRALDMRYEGQGYELEVRLPPEDELASVLPQLPARFAAEYARVFSLSFADKPVEIVNWKLEAALAESDDDFRLADETPSATAATRIRRAYFPEADGFVDGPVYDRRTLRPGSHIAGPAIIEEPESTCIVGMRETVRVDERLNLVAEIAVTG